MVHMTGVFHVVALSIVRYFSLKRISEVRSTLPWLTYQKSVASLVIIYVSMLIVCGPIYFHSEITEVPFHETCTSKFPNLNGTIAYELSVRNPALQQINFWLFGSICKLIPCFVLFVMTFFILDRLKHIRHMNDRFGSHERDRRYDRTTKMILIIMLIFIAVELPQGIMAVLQSVTQLGGMQELGDLFEMLTLLTSCTIFALLCSMNSSLRNELYRLFCHRFQRWTDSRKHRKKNETCVELTYLVSGNDNKAIRMSPPTSVEC
uniref:G_PROTEIN_RECEP_F1_2 domain-containing protein n=1 Tax=Steinernema glaseri TaxID=37863 RepID=A0A1I7ZVB6_9BILA